MNRTSLFNPRTVNIDTEAYRTAHGKAPRGQGTWVFGIVNFEGTQDWTTTGLYSEEVRVAQIKAGQRGWVIVRP